MSRPRYIHGLSPPRPPEPPKPRYRPSGKHCEPITAEKPGTKCPSWSIGIAQDLLENSIQVGDKRFATHGGLAFVAQITEGQTDVWHGYPEAWDKVPIAI